MQSRSRSQLLLRPPPGAAGAPGERRKLQNIWTMRPLGGTGGALKALAKNVAQHMNLNRSTLKRVVAQVVAEHHNLGQVDDYKGHMYYAKPERLNFLNLIAQSKEALDDLLLLDPRFAKKLQRKDQMRRFLRQHQKPPKAISSVLKFKKVAGGHKASAPVPARGRGSSSTVPGAASGRCLNGVVMSTTHLVGGPRVPKTRPKVMPVEKGSPWKPQPEKLSPRKPQTGQPLVEQVPLVRSRSPLRQPSKSAVRSRRSQRQLNTRSSFQRLPAGATPRKGGGGVSPKKAGGGGAAPKKPLALAKTRSQVRQLVKKNLPKAQKMGQKVGQKMGQKIGPTIGQKIGPKLGQKPGQSLGPKLSQNLGQKLGEKPLQNPLQKPLQNPLQKPLQNSLQKPGQEEKANQTNLSEKDPDLEQPLSKSVSRSVSQSPRSRSPLRSPSPMPSKSSVTGTTILSRRSHKDLSQPPVKSQSKLRQRQRQRQLPIFRNYDKPWLVPRMKRRRRLAAGGYQVAKKESPRKLDQISVEWVKKDGARSEQSPREEVKPKARSHVGRQMRKVDFPWYTPYQYQSRSTSPPPRASRFGPNLTCRQRHHRLMQERLNRDLRREEAIDTMLNYGSGLFRRHRGEWVPAMKSSFQQSPRRSSSQLRQREVRSSSQHRQREVRSSSHRLQREVSPPRRSSSQHLRKNPPKPVKERKPIQGIQGGQLPQPPPSAVSSDARVRPQGSSMNRRRTRRQPAVPADSSLGSYADLFQPADSKEILTRAKRRLSIAFMSKQGRSSSPRRRRPTPVWK